MSDEKVNHEALLELSSSTDSKHKSVNDELLPAGANDSRAGEKGNILSQYSEKQAMLMGRNYALKHNLDPDLFARAAALARNPLEFNSMEFLSEEEKISLNKEVTRRWHILASWSR